MTTTSIVHQIKKEMADESIRKQSEQQRQREERKRILQGREKTLKGLLFKANQNFQTMLKESSEFRELVERFVGERGKKSRVLAWGFGENDPYGVGITEGFELGIGCLYYRKMNVPMQEMQLPDEVFDEFCNLLCKLSDAEGVIRFLLVEFPSKEGHFTDFPLKNESRIPLE